MKTFLCTLIALTTFAGYSQQFIGLKTSAVATYAHPSSTNGNFFMHPKTTLAGGITYDIFSGNHFSFGAEILYTKMGFSQEGYDFAGAGIIGDAYYTFKNTYDYLSIPLKLGYRTKTSSNFYGFFNGGLSFSKMLKHKSISTEAFTGHASSYAEDETFSNMRYEMIALSEVGFGYILKENLIIFFSFTYQNSLTKTSISTSYTYSDARLSATAISTGIKYKLN